MIGYYLDLCGLFLNLSGTMIIAKFGLPQTNYATSGKRTIVTNKDPELAKSEKFKYFKHLRKARVGISLIILGFALQFIQKIFFTTT